MGLWQTVKQNARNMAEMKRNTITLHYDGGHPQLTTAKDVAVGSTETHLVIYEPISYKPLVEIPKEDILGVQFGKDVVRYRSAGKAAAGAIIGGVLTGGIGLLAGAALGGRRRRKDESTIDVAVNYGKMEVALSFSGPGIKEKHARFMGLLA